MTFGRDLAHLDVRPDAETELHQRGDGRVERVLANDGQSAEHDVDCREPQRERRQRSSVHELAQAGVPEAALRARTISAPAKASASRIVPHSESVGTLPLATPEPDTVTFTALALDPTCS